MADTERPITDWLEELLTPAGAGVTLGTLLGLVARHLANAILYVWRGYGVADADMPSYTTFIGISAPIGGIAMLVLWAVEPHL